MLRTYIPLSAMFWNSTLQSDYAIYIQLRLQMYLNILHTDTESYYRECSLWVTPCTLKRLGHIPSLKETIKRLCFLCA
jgi:hypothetical protein